MKRIVLFVALAAWSGLCGAVVYKWTDGQGKVQYGDSPPDGVNAEIVEMPGNRPAQANSGRQASSPPPAARNENKAPPGNATATSGVADPAQKAVADDVAQMRDKQCADAQDRYKKLIEGRRLYKAGPDGERQYLSSEEIDAERVSAKRDVDSICNSPT